MGGEVELQGLPQLVDHGLRKSERALLTVASFNLVDGAVTFYRLKVDLEQTHKLTADTLRALQRYCDAGDCPARG